MKPAKLTKAQEKCLRDQVITADEPGPVLRDFGMLLEFLGSEGVEAGGKYNLLPIKLIGELDQLLSRPLRLELKRPQLRSHPYLQGLNLLLRASGLTQVEGSGAKARLVLDPVMRSQWDRLNPTEQYFQLLEAWLRFGRAEMVGERGSSWRGMFVSCEQLCKRLPEKALRFDLTTPQDVYLPFVGRDFYQVALMDLFGLLEVELPPRPVTPWAPAGVKNVPFGNALLTLLGTERFGSLLRNEDDSPEEGVEEEDEEKEDDEADGEDELEAPELPRFGAWQPLLQPYFPEWRENLEFLSPEPREGEYIFRVSLGKVWRLIAMPAKSTLDDLVSLVLRSMKFDNDHLYQFTYRDRLGATASAMHPAMDEGPWADLVPIGTLPLEPGQTMQLVYDFGDNWHFNLKLERIEPPAAKPKPPRILERHGEAPTQYPNWDE